MARVLGDDCGVLGLAVDWCDHHLIRLTIARKGITMGLAEELTPYSFVGTKMSNKETIARLRSEADALEAADKVFSELPEDERLAITLHDLLCHSNHVDACGWEYEYLEKPRGWEGPSVPDWKGHAHSRYLIKARRVQTCCRENHVSVDGAIAIMKIAQEF
jgi:hypothetical protein